MANVTDVAAYILTSMAPDTPMVTRKLQKLTYYAQAWSLAWTGAPMFVEDIEAWRDGPVVRRLYAEHHHQWTVTSVPAGDAHRLDDDQRKVIDAVLAHYGPFDFSVLTEFTHRERPWIDARRHLPPGAHSQNRIPVAAMKAYYSALGIDGYGPQQPPSLRTVSVGAAQIEVGLSEDLATWSDSLDWLAVR